MAFDASKTLLLEKQYLYVRASKGFQLEGVSTERIWTNTGYYRFLVSNVAESLGNSYITIHYDSTDIDFIAYCSDLFMEELQNSVVVAVENLESYLQQFAEINHSDIETFSENVGTAFGLVSSKLDSIDSTIKGLNDVEVYRFDKTTKPSKVVVKEGSKLKFIYSCENFSVGDASVSFVDENNQSHVVEAMINDNGIMRAFWGSSFTIRGLSICSIVEVEILRVNG